MKQENLEFLKKSFEYRGFGAAFDAGLEENMKAGREEFVLEENFELQGDKMRCQAHLRKHSEHDHYYFNHYIATLAGKDGEASAKIKTKWKVNLPEAHRLLKHGDKVAVYKSGIKNDEGEKFNAYINFSLDQTDERGHCRLNMYHDNYYQKYPFVIEESIARIPIPIKFKKTLEKVKQDLMSAIPVPVMMELDGRQQEGYLTINAGTGRVEVADKQLEAVEFSKKQHQAQKVNATQEVPSAQQSESPAPEVKKKPWHEQSSYRKERIRHKSPSL